MKYVGIAILAIGVGTTAAYAARQTDALFAHRTLQGRAQFLEARVDEAREAYCAARGEAGLASVPVCRGDTETPGDEDRAGPTGYEQRIRRAQRELRQLRDEAPANVPAAVADARSEWIDAKERALEPVARAETEEPPGQMERLESWLGESGGPFALGIVLVLVGAVVGRVGVRREAAAGNAGGAGAASSVPLADFRRVLDTLQGEVASLADETKDNRSPREHDEHYVRSRIETLQLEKLEPLVEARQQFQLRYGLAGFAAVFEPLSGGERKLQRAWSALVDHHWTEAVASLQAASGEFARASEELQRVTGSAAPRSN